MGGQGSLLKDEEGKTRPGKELGREDQSVQRPEAGGSLECLKTSRVAKCG